MCWYIFYPKNKILQALSMCFQTHRGPLVKDWPLWANSYCSGYWLFMDSGGPRVAKNKPNQMSHHWAGFDWIWLHLAARLQFYIVKENRGNEGTCVGVSRWPVHDFNHRTTSDMWLYRAYSGNLYHNGEQTLTLGSFTQGDFITCVLDMEARTISFGKNGEVRARRRRRAAAFAGFLWRRAESFCCPSRSQSWPSRTWTPPSCTRVWCSTAATQERRLEIFWWPHSGPLHYTLLCAILRLYGTTSLLHTQYCSTFSFIYIFLWLQKLYALSINQ